MGASPHFLQGAPLPRSEPSSGHNRPGTAAKSNLPPRSRLLIQAFPVKPHRVPNTPMVSGLDGQRSSLTRQPQSGDYVLVIAFVANQESQAPETQQRAGCRPRSVMRLAHLPGEAAVPPGGARLLSAWQPNSGRVAVFEANGIVPLSCAA
jgi:hypothetical protein